MYAVTTPLERVIDPLVPPVVNLARVTVPVKPAACVASGYESNLDVIDENNSSVYLGINASI